MELKDDEATKIAYYNQVLKESRSRSKKKSRASSFASKEVDLSQYIFAPQGYEGIFYTLHVIIVPYIVGLLFLFVTIAKVNVDNFMLLDLNRFFVVWAIGYEITASLLLLFIFVLFLKYDADEEAN